MERGFFKSLFDFSFSSFVTVRLIKVIYALFIAGSALLALVFVASSFRASVFAGLFTLLIIAPVLFFLYVILARVYLELVVAIFRIAENTSILAGQGRSLSAPMPPSSGPPPPPPHDGPPPPPTLSGPPPSATPDGPPPPPEDPFPAEPPPPPPVEAEPPPPPPTAEVELPVNGPASTQASPRPAPRVRPRRQAPLRPLRPTTETPPEPPA